MIRTCSLPIVLALVFMLASGVRAQNVSADEAKKLLRLLPKDAPAAIAVPNLKRLSDQITHALEGMDRANLLMGARPLDQFKAITGFNVGLDDAGGFAIVLIENPGVNEVEPKVAFVVPVSDAQTFLDGNFTRNENGTYVTAAGQTLHAKVIGSHVALAGNEAALANLSDARTAPDSLAGLINDGTIATIANGEAFILARGEALQSALELFTNQAAKFDAAFPIPPLGITAVTRDVDVAMVSFDFDPLALVVRSFGGAKPQSALAEIAHKLSGGNANLSRLPNKQFYFAAAIVSGKFDEKSLQALGFSGLPQWITRADSIQIAAYPSPAGMAGGLLNDAALVIETKDPAALKADLRQWLSNLQSAAIKREIKWEENKQVQGAGVADAYEIRTVQVPGEHALQQAIEQALVGRTNWRGFVATTANSVILTFSQRPAVLAAVVGVNEAQSLEQFSAIRVMQQWMPPNPSLQIYIGVGSLAQIAQQAATAAGLAARGPQIDPALPPVGTAIAARDGAIVSSTVIPAGVLAMLFDQALAQAAARNQATDDDGPVQTDEQ